MIIQQTNTRTKKVAIIVGLGIITLSSAILLITQTKKSEPVVSPVPKAVADYDENEKSISYYITTSQEFLNKARSLANSAGSEQTPEEKQEILATINQALDLANQAIAVYPHDDRGFSQRASIYQALIPFLPESTQLAITDLKQATQLNARNPDYFRQLAKLHSAKGEFENASLATYNAHVLSPTNVQTLYDLADYLEKSGQLNKASRYFEKLMALMVNDDENFEIVKARKMKIDRLLTQSGLEHLSEPGQEAPSMLNAQEETIIGTQELPLEQASLAHNLIIAEAGQDPGESDTGEIDTNAKTGNGTILAGQTEVVIENNHVAADKQIVIVATSETENQVVYLAARKENSWFKVSIDQPIGKNIKFDWWIVN